MYSIGKKVLRPCFATLKIPKRLGSSSNVEEILSGPYNFIDGSRISPAEPQSTVDVCNPATGDTFGLMPVSSIRDINTAVTSSRKAFDIWSEVGTFSSF